VTIHQQADHAGQTFAEHVADYALAGWPCVFPVPSHDKHPPPVGFTGAEGRDTPPEQLVAWAGSHPGHSIALRMPDGVIGIDVDQYEKKGTQKRGAETLAACVAKWGPLPPTWSSTARGPGQPSRILLFRAPAQRYATKLTGQQPDGQGGFVTTGDIEVIQRHHRYAVVWPSPHTETGQPYRWYDPTGAAADRVPSPSELAELPAAWVAGLAEGASAAAPASAPHAAGEALLDQLRSDWRPECAEITSARLQAVEELGRSDAGSRHDAMTARVHHLIQLAAHGHAGVAHALAAVTELWAALTAGEDREDELERSMRDSARKAVTVVGAVQLPLEPCLSGGTVLQVQAPTPGDDRPADPTRPELVGVEADQQWNIRTYIGVEAFDPLAQLDQKLAHSVLQRTAPAVRYAFDSRTWLLRLTDRWETRRELAPWLVSEVAWLMPLGDPTAEKGSDPHTRAAVRQRLMTNAGAKAVAGKIDALVAAGTYPGSVALGDLDADPEVLWAGGVPWSLRFSDVEPVLAEHIDPNTPHMHSCGVTPAVVPTPMWDAFLAAVWPDPGTRAWALRVLSIAFTGYADRALPVLLGETGRGKTQVVDLLMSVLGSYAHAANPKLLTNTGAHDTIRYSLKGRRLSFIDEAPAENRAGQEHLKQLTGGGEITANQMHKDPITFRPTHTLVLTANDEPLLTDPAVRARVRLIPCEGDPEQVRAARAAIGSVRSAGWRAEAPGVLASMMREAAGWLADPSTGSMEAAPEHLMYLAELLGAEQDPVTVWLTEETEPFEAGTPSRELYQAFRASCQRSGHRNDLIPTETRWGRELERRGYPAMRTKYGNRRPLRVRSGGFLPGMPDSEPSTTPTTSAPPAGPVPTAQAPSTPSIGGGLDRTGAGFVQGSDPNPAPLFSQVNPTVSVAGGGYAGFDSSLTRTHTPACAQEPQTETTLQPSTPSVPARSARQCRECGGTTGAKGVHDSDCATGKAAQAKTEAARTKRAEAAATKRLEAIAAASGAQVALPALLTRDGAIRSIGLAQADALLATITGESGHGELTVDVEHTGYPIGHRHYALRTIQLGDENLAVVLDHEGPDASEHDAVARRHLAAARVLHAHSASADIVPLAVDGLIEAEEAWTRMVDTGTLAKIADPALTGNSDDLKGLAKAMLGDAALAPAADAARAELFKAGKWKTDIEVTHEIEQSGWAQVDHHSETMARYDGSDVLDCAAIARRLPALAPDQLHRERTAQRMTARVAHTGFRFVPEQIDRLHDEHSTSKAKLAALIPVENPGSNDQLGAMLTAMGAALPRTGTGKPSVAKGVLEPIAGARGSERTWAAEATSEVQHMARVILDWRHADTALKLFLDPWRDMVRNGDGRARSTVHTLGADTGRMSSVRFNLQQISREGGMRACISADPGYLLITADFASVEIRVAAALSQDKALIEMLLNGVDLHAEIAKLVWGPSFTKSNRYMAKRKVFGRIYGQGVDGMARTDGAGVDVARSVISAMDAMTPGLTEWSRMLRGGVESGHTQYPTYAGRVIHLPKAAPHAGPNYAIQGTARELLIDALMRWEQTPWGHCTLMPVHDEILAMVPEHQALEATEALKACMATELYGVPIVAEADEPSFEWKDSA
jgi:phage/plasmid-associated DNA primase